MQICVMICCKIHFCRQCVQIKDITTSAGWRLHFMAVLLPTPLSGQLEAGMRRQLLRAGGRGGFMVQTHIVKLQTKQTL
jgi:hypothetical protein